MMNRLKLLLVAHHMNPEWGSEPLISWRWATTLQDHVDLVVVTHVRNREAIERARGLRAEIHYVDTERLARRVNRVNDLVWPSSAIVARSFLESFAKNTRTLATEDHATDRFAIDPLGRDLLRDLPQTRAVEANLHVVFVVAFLVVHGQGNRRLRACQELANQRSLKDGIADKSKIEIEVEAQEAW